MQSLGGNGRDVAFPFRADGVGQIEGGQFGRWRVSEVTQIDASMPARAVEVAGGFNAFPVTIEVSDKRFFDRDREFYIQAGVRGQAVIVVEEDLSLITLVWEKIVNFVDFGVNAE